jgi:S-adenosylmethionine:tRNA-ribosyltransferase-isomerase (queuine synthetase)
VTPEEIIQKIIEKVEDGDPEVLARISLVMKNRVLNKKQDLQEIEVLLKAQTGKWAVFRKQLSINFPSERPFNSLSEI